MLWEKAILLVPLWSILFIPIIGFFCRGMGTIPMQMGYGLVLVLCANYFFQDLLKRKIRLDDEYIYFGFRAIPIRNLIAINVDYNKRNLLPKRLVISIADGKSLKLGLNGLSKDNVEILIKHLQSRNSNLKAGPVLTTLIKCRRVTPKTVMETADRLTIPYNGRQLLDESVDTFRSTAKNWMRLGPLIVCLFAGPVWTYTLSLLYLCLQPNSFQYLQSINLHYFLNQCLVGLQTNIITQFQHTSETAQHFAENPGVMLITTAFISLFMLYVQRLFLRPNVLIADKEGIRLILQLGDISFPLGKAKWNDITRASLYKPARSAGTEQWKIRLTKTTGKHFVLDVSALAVEDRARLIRRIEKMVPGCEIDPELAQGMLPRSDHSYTELWLQSLSQAPQRKTLEPLEPGQLVGDERFQVVKRLGVGGQGTAYLCKDIHTEPVQFVVLKETILPVFVENSVRKAALERFEQEARMVQLLDSDRIVKVLSFFIEDHRCYLVLEHIDGSNLRELVLREGPLQQQTCRDIALQFCEILEVLHTKSIVHRDFTPDNLMLNSSGKVKLIDFNVAQLNSGSTGTIVGKQAYVPPEQFRGKATSQSDIYAMGATLYFLLTGTDPEAISQSSPAKTNPEIAAEFDAIVRKATALQLEKRYTSGKELEADLLVVSENG
jgi:hypothetical protein